MPTATNYSATDDEAGAERPDLLQLAPGINFTAWGELKWARANRHLADLQTSFTEWHSSVPVFTEGIFRDDETIDVIQRAPRGVPIHEWALTLGDAVHNLRSAFDAVAWGIAHFGDGEPERPWQVEFPIARDAKQWRRSVERWIGKLDPEFQHRIETLQPFTYAAEADSSLLAILHDLDIRDKHRRTIQVSANVNRLDLRGAVRYVDPSADAEPRLEMHAPAEGIHDGYIVATLHTGAPIHRDATFRLQPELTMVMEHNETTYDVSTFGVQLVTETRRYLDILYSGLASDQ